MNFQKDYFHELSQTSPFKMKQKLLLITVLMCLNLVPSFAGEGPIYNYGPHGKNYFELATDKILIKFKSGMSFKEKQAIIGSERLILPLENGDVLPAPEVTIARIASSSASQIEDLLSRLKAVDAIDYANPFLISVDGTYEGLQNRILVKLKSDKDLSALNKFATEFGLSMAKRNEFDNLLFSLETTKQSAFNALEISNKISESGLVAFCEPDFLKLLKRFSTNDPNLPSQWSLNNTGSSAQYNGTPGADMEIFDAWGITTGSSSIRVAVIDEGVDLVHPDLLANLVAGYDATGQGSNGGPSGNDAHGTACAGIIAAVGNNNVGIAGVAYSCKIVPVRIAYSNTAGSWVTSNTWIGNALNWSWQTGQADVLSNSWGGGSSSSVINSAITGAVTSGRGGLGSPVLFAAGNDNGANSYPATEVNTISVIAMSMCYQRKNPSSCDGETWWGSNYGTGADVAAPGVKIYTTDISGSAGYSTGNYTATFNGTSSATPNTAGVMALILSANPSITQSQARFALESTCAKVGGYAYTSNVSGQPNGTWSNDLGYGLVSAFQALSSLAPPNQLDAGILSISAPSGRYCTSTVTPVVTLKNFGSNALTSVNIKFQVDAGALQTYNWTGNLASGASANITLAAQTVSPGNHTFTAYTLNPNGSTDQNNANDSKNTSFISATNAVTLTIVLDNYPEETSWSIIDGSSTVVASGGTYGSFADGSTVTENLCLQDGCFTFIINDAYGDGICCAYGNGSYQLMKNSDGTILANGGQFTSSQSTPFCLQPSSTLAATFGNQVNVSCFGGATGSVSVNASGGTPPYSYAWSNGASTSSVSGLSAGPIDVAVSDASGATVNLNTTITQPSNLVVSLTTNHVTCNGLSNGSISLSVSGGTSPYSYAWSTGATSQNLTNLAAGNYSVILTDANGCTATRSTTVAQPTDLTASVNATNASCFGGNSGSISLNVSGGTAPYSYNWSNGAASQNLSNLIAGNYTVTITDENGCTINRSASITQPVAITANVNATNPTCNGANNGSISLFASGGVTPYTYVWSNGATTQNISNLNASAYTVTLTDANGCSINRSATLSQPSTIIATVNASPVSCFGNNNGAVSLNVSGGTAPYSYAWSTGATTQNVSGLGAGLYTVTISDANGCTSSQSATVTEPVNLVASVTSTNVACSGGTSGSISLIVSGGTAPYTYVWSTGANTSDISNLGTGNYSVLISDANGCSVNRSASISQPTAISASATATNTICSSSSGSINLSVSGGIQPYSYSWSNGATNQNISNLNTGTYSVVITDANGCNSSAEAIVGQTSDLSASASAIDANCAGANDGSVSVTISGGNAPYNIVWSTGNTGSSVSQLSAGNYTVSVSDANGCSASSAAIVSEPSALSIVLEGLNPQCYGEFNGQITSTISGGTAPYAYAWSTGSTGTDLTNIGPGTFSLTITDSHGCTGSSSKTLLEPSQIIGNVSVIDISCQGASNGSASSAPIGGSAPYNYAWSNGASSSSISNLSSGNYSLMIIDASGCKTSHDFQVNEPATLSANSIGSEIPCSGASGSVTSQVTGGVIPYSYLWSNGSASADLNGVPTGNYSLTVTDANGCTASTSSLVTSLPALSANTSSISANCFGERSGSANVSVQGGTSPYSILWSTGDNSNSISGLIAGNYSVQVIDINGCSANASVTITEPSLLSVAVSSNNETCATNDGSASAISTGGVSPYNYAWSTGGTTSEIQGLNEGDYQLTITDINGCQANGSITIGNDCGGCTYVIIDENNFESGLGIWTDGGVDCALVSNATFSNSGTFSVSLQDNTSESVMTTTSLDLSSYSELTVAFSYYPVSMDNATEDFWLQLSQDGGSSFTTIEEWNFGDEFVNNQRYSESIVIAGTFSANTQIRFRCDASGDADWVYIDDVKISGCQVPQTPTCNDGIQNGDETGVDCGGVNCIPCATCFDGIQNGDETGIDCGGANCIPCAGTCNYVTVNTANFDSNWGIWNDGGGDCARVSNATYSSSGTFSIQIRDNSAAASSMFTDVLDLSSYEELTLAFHFRANSMENGEDFFVQYNTGAGYTTVATFVSGSNFNNGVSYYPSIVIPGPFTATTSIRVMCDASANNDQVYIDDFVITGCFNSSLLRTANPLTEMVAEENQRNTITAMTMDLHPNPATDAIQIRLSDALEGQVELRVTDMSGKLVQVNSVSVNSSTQTLKLETNLLSSGLYTLSLISKGQALNKRFVIQR